MCNHSEDVVLKNAVCALVGLAIVVMIAAIVVLRPNVYGERVKFIRATGHLEFIK